MLGCLAVSRLGKSAQAKVYGVQEIAVCPGVTAADCERYLREEIGAIASVFPGWRMFLAQSDRGTRNGKYAIAFEIESVEARSYDYVLVCEGPH